MTQQVEPFSFQIAEHDWDTFKNMYDNYWSYIIDHMGYKIKFSNGPGNKMAEVKPKKYTIQDKHNTENVTFTIEDI